MLIHASCAARRGSGVLLSGPPGSGKSDLVFRLLDRGFDLVADDQVDIEGSLARPPKTLAGLLEVRGVGIVRMAYVAPAQLILSVILGRSERLPSQIDGLLGLPIIALDPASPSAAQRIDLALDCLLGRVEQVVGAFDAC